MSSSKHSYDVIVIGAGMAGMSAVESARSLGASVCLVERGRLGGTFLNDVDIPSKALSRTAKFYRSLQDAKRFGVTIGSSSYSFEDVMRYRDTVVESLTGGGLHGDLLEKQLNEWNVDVRFASARFEDDHVLSVGGESLYGKTIVIATGSVEEIPELKGLEAIHFLTPKDLFAKKRQPKSLAIIGGGSMACEIATIFAAFGTRVVLLEQASQILSHEEEECVQIVEEQMRRSGIEIVKNANIVEIVDGLGGVLGIKVRVNESTSMHAVEQIVIANGKRFDDTDLGLHELKLKRNVFGCLNTFADQATSIPHLFAAGDACAGESFARDAQEEGSVAGFNAARLALGKRMPRRTLPQQVIPCVTFTNPELASVGFVADEVKKKFGHVAVGRCAYANLYRSFTDHEPIGLVKLVAHPKTHKILGGTIVGARASEMIQEIAVAIQMNATAEKLASIMCTRLTYTEGIRIAASKMKTE